ncbi:MAG: hypothetical protein AAGA90_12830 [Actinomycetota bacterium]
MNDVTVVDPAGRWMQAWHDGFEQQRIGVLRSPGVHHPDPDDMAYIHAHSRGRSFEATCAGRRRDGVVGPLQRPTTEGFRRFCDDLLRRTGLRDRVRAGRVRGLRRLPAVSGRSGWEARLDDDTLIHARQVVWAANPRVLRSPSGVDVGGAIEHSGTVQLADVLPGERIAVLGGGQTAGQLAMEAARRGTSVTLISRNALRIADLDVDAGWLMADHLDPFHATADPAERRRIVEDAQRGSMTADLERALRRLQVSRVCDAGPLSAWTDERGAVVGFAGVECPVDRVWVATGARPDLRAAPALAAIAHDGEPHVDGWPVLDEALAWCPGLHVIGGLAALQLGPAAGNLGGARAAADLLAARAPVVPATVGWSP